MVQLKNYLLSFYRSVTSSIAFYPVVISIGFTFLAIIIMALDNENALTTYLLDNMSFLVINNADTARTILSTFIAGLLSLTVFSFSMVMLILNQASSNYSPRLLPGLVANKRHQMVLGTFLGTIIYSVLILISILPDGDTYTLPGFGILLGIFFGIGCLGVFVYFIHSISQEIQIDNILKRIFERTKKQLESLRDREKESIKLPNTDLWSAVYSIENGYYQGINKNTLIKLTEELDTVLAITSVKGLFTLKDLPVLKSKKELSEEDKEKILSCLHYASSPIEGGNYTYGIKQIVEIAVKAMSPGINDPGTAINAIDYLTELFALRKQIEDKEYYVDGEEHLRVIQTTMTFKELLYQHLASLRQYCKHDVVLTQKLLLMLKYLTNFPSQNKSNQDVVKDQINILMIDAKLFIKNKEDLSRVEELAKQNPESEMLNQYAA